MSIFGFVRQKMAYARQKRSEYVDKKVITGTAKLERAIKIRQQEEKKAFIEQELSKEKALIREHRTAKFRGAISNLKSLKSKIPKAKGKGIYKQDRGVSLGGPGPQFGLGNKKKSPFDIRVKK